MSKVSGFNWRIMAGVAVATLGIFFNNIASAADDVGSLLSEKLKRFTPPDMVVVTPTDDVPKECAAFTGEWGSSRIPRTNLATKLAVESVATDCTIKVVVVWAEPRSFANDPGAGWARHNAKIVQGEFVIPGISGGATWNLKMSSSGTELEVYATNARGGASTSRSPGNYRYNSNLAWFGHFL